MATIRNKSREDFRIRADIPTESELRTGALQRIADATEAMARNHQELLADLDRFKRWFREELEKRQHAERQVAALRGVITKMKQKAERQEDK